MYKPISVYIGLKNCFGSNASFFTKFVARSSQIGVILGVSALIVVMSVMNGFKDEMVEKFLASTPHIILNPITNKPAININRYKNFKFYPIEAAVSFKQHFLPIRVAASTIAKPGQVIIPSEIAQVYGVNASENIKVFAAQSTMLDVPRSKTQTIKIEVLPEWQKNYAYVSIDLAERLGLIAQEAQPNINIFIKQPITSDKIAKIIANDNPGWQVDTWQNVHKAFFQLIATQKSMMFLVLFFIIIIAGFGLISSQVMLVQEKRREIAILTTMGCSHRILLVAYFIQGLWLGLLGLLLGVVLGLILANNVSMLVKFIEEVTGQAWLSHALYGMDHMPSKILSQDIIQIFASGLILCAITPIYPAFLACKTEPIKIFRQVEGG